MHWFCYECVAKKVNAGKISPLIEIYGANNTPFKRGAPCDLCRKIDDCSTVVMHPEMEQYLKKEKQNEF